MSELKIKQARTSRRVNRTRNKIGEQAGKLRLSVFASNKYMYAQIIDDAKGTTVISAAAKELTETGTKTELARALGNLLAQKAKEKKVTSNIVFDKGRYKYHGRVKAFAEAAREGGLKF
jgi:large subunit ribosomal protein L18